MATNEFQTADELISSALSNAAFILKHAAPDVSAQEAIAAGLAAVAQSNAAIAAAILETHRDA